MYKGDQSKPVHTTQQPAYIKDGWSFKKGATHAKESDSKAEAKEAPKEESVLSRDELAESLGISLYDEDGKKLHYKLIDSAIKEAQSNGEHNEG